MQKNNVIPAVDSTQITATATAQAVNQRYKIIKMTELKSEKESFKGS
jgi:hypothetical protein